MAKFITADGFEGLIAIPLSYPRYWYTALMYPLRLIDFIGEIPKTGPPIRRIYEYYGKIEEIPIYREIPG